MRHNIFANLLIISGLESSDDILAKYRRKPSLTDGASGDNALVNRAESNTSSNSKTGTSNSVVARKDSLKISRTDFIIEARRKLRNVLSSCDLQMSQVGFFLFMKWLLSANFKFLMNYNFLLYRQQILLQ